jgi:hypothetical protein
MFLYHFTKSGSRVASILGFLAISNIVLVNSADAFSATFSNGGFENSTTGWSTIGDVTTKGSIDNISPISGSSQAIITNAHSSRTDDVNGSGNSLSFNQSGTNPVDADTITTNHTGNDLQTSFGLSTDALSIDRNPVVTGNPRTSKEGSGIYQDIPITISSDDVTNGKNGFKISFNWAYLTNDGKSSLLGNQDFAFLSVYNTSSSPGAINVLSDSLGTITAPSASNNFVHENTTYYSASNPYTYSVNSLAAGSYTYRVGFGVVDVDGSDLSSALLVDNFNVEEVPFEFSPSLGLGIVAVIFGCDRLRRIRSKTVDNFSERSPINH